MKSLAEIIPKILGANKQLDKLVILFEAWPEIIPSEYLELCELSKIVYNKVYIKCHPALLLSFPRELVKYRLLKLFNEEMEVIVRVK